MTSYTNTRDNSTLAGVGFKDGDDLTTANGSRWVYQNEQWYPVTFGGSPSVQSLAVTTTSAQGVGFDAAVAQGIAAAARDRAVRASHTLMPIPAFNPVADAATYGRTVTMALSLSTPFKAVQIGYVHAGGQGALVGATMLVAATDDIGTGNYGAGVNDPGAKKFTTPRRAGIEVNTLSGPDAWSTVYFNGAASLGIADPGVDANSQPVISVGWSDPVNVNSVVDSRGKYNLLVRINHGSGAYTKIDWNGIVTGSQYIDESGGQTLLIAQKTGNSAVDPTQWAYSAQPSYLSTYLPCIIVRVWSDAPTPTVYFRGDSRFEAATEVAATKAYAGLPFLLQSEMRARGRPIDVIRGGRDGAKSLYLHDAWDSIINSSGITPTVSVGLIWTVNDGTASAANIAIAKSRAAAFVERCRAIGSYPVLVTAYPKTGLISDEYARLLQLRDWAGIFSCPVLDPIRTYGDGAGGWAAGANTDVNHMTQATYALFAKSLADAIEPAISLA